MLPPIPAHLVEEPERIAADCDWTGHIPFAFWLVEALRPRTLVELGVGGGTSYSAFCQGMKRSGVFGACYGIGSWTSDGCATAAHAELGRHHDSRYSAFSRLVDCALDEAAQGFEDRSVDLLHIRMHADAALGHLFDRWRPKLSDRAVLLLHGISARERGTGAWQFWDEIARRFPHFAFLHSHGLGIAGIGGSLPESAGVLLGLSEPESVAVRSVFASLGERLVRAEELRRRADAAEARAVEVAPLECHVRELEVRLAAAAAAAEALEKELASRTQESRALKGAEELLQGSCIVLQKELEGRAEDCERLTVTVAELNREVAQLNGEVAQLNGEIAEFAAERAALTERVESLDQHYHAMANSASWRLTRPLRGARMTMRSLGGRLRRRRAPAGDGQ